MFKSADASRPSITMSRLLGTVAEASSLPCVESEEWERFGVLRSSPATPPPGFATLSFPGGKRANGSFNGTDEEVTRDGAGTASGILGEELAQGMVADAKTNLYPSVARRTSDTGRLPRTVQVQSYGKHIVDIRGHLQRSGSTQVVGQPFARRMSFLAQLVHQARALDLPGVGDTA